MWNLLQAFLLHLLPAIYGDGRDDTFRFETGETKCETERYNKYICIYTYGLYAFYLKRFTSLLVQLLLYEIITRENSRDSVFVYGETTTAEAVLS